MGEIVKWCEESERYAVKPQDGETKAFKMSNLEVLSAPGHGDLQTSAMELANLELAGAKFRQHAAEHEGRGPEQFLRARDAPASRV